jgi:homoprotocatechuate degradation regulator HpaR
VAADKRPKAGAETDMTSKLPSTARSLPIALIRAREGVMAPIRDMLAETGITEQQWRVLRVLSEHGALDTTTLADRSSILFPSLTRMVTTMREKGLITQTRDDVDRRRQFIEITADGQKIIDDRAVQSARVIANFKTTLGDENYEILLDLLAKLDPGSRD